MADDDNETEAELRRRKDRKMRRQRKDLDRSLLAERRRYMAERRNRISVQERQLHEACSAGRVDDVRRLIVDQGVDPAYRDYRGRTALYHACEGDHAHVVKFLLDRINITKTALTEDDDGDTPFSIACSMGHVHLLDILYDAGAATINSRNKIGETALHAACKNQHLQVVKWLLDKSADVHVKDFRGCTPFHVACEEGNNEITGVLLENEADLNAQNGKGQTPLHIACTYKHLQIAEALLEKGTDPNVRDSNGQTSLHVACSVNQKEIADKLLQNGADPNVRDSEGETPVHTACTAAGDAPLVLMLADRGADIYAQSKHGTTPLHLTCSSGHAELTKWLIEKGAEKDVKDFKGRTPVHMACRKNHDEVVKELLVAGVAVNSRDNEGDTPFSVACCNDNTHILDMLVESGANIDTRSDHGATPLHYACYHGCTRVFHWLVDRGADIEVKDVYGWCLLHTATKGDDDDWEPFKRRRGRKKESYVEIVNTLLQNGASVDARNNENATPFAIACVKGHTDLMDVLAKFGADIETRSADGTTPLHAACHEDRTKSVKWLLDRKVDVDARDEHGWTALHHACCRGTRQSALFLMPTDDDLVTVLLAGGAGIDARNSDGVTPLYIACLFSCEDTVNALLEKHPDINARTRLGTTALHVASTEGNDYIVRLLLESGADVDARDERGDTPLICACRNNHTGIANALIDRGADISVSNDNGNTALHIASRHSDHTLIQRLLHHKADLNLQAVVDPDDGTGSTTLLPTNAVEINSTNNTGNTPLHETCSYGNVNIATMLLDTINEKGNTALHEACAAGFTEIVRTLLVGGADVNVTNKEMETPLQVAEKHNHQYIVDELLKSGADVNNRDLHGDTALISACNNGHTHIATTLLDYGADVSVKNISGDTPLICACRNGHTYGNTEVVTLLVKRGCDLNAVNEKGNAALHEACISGEIEIVRSLLAGDADIHATNNDTLTPLQLAQEHDHVDIINILNQADRERTEELKSQFIFSEKCQFSGEFSNSGGQLQGDSDVILTLPENAIQHSEKVTIAGAVSVDLNAVHDTLKLGQDEFIMSPVVEYATDRKRFSKPLNIHLPHFLPSSFSLYDIRVYQFYKEQDGGICTEKLTRLTDEEDVTRPNYDARGGSFCLSQTGCIVVFTSCLRGAFTVTLKSLHTPRELHLRLYGQHAQRDTRDVDLYFLLSDKRLAIRDFRKLMPGLEKENETKKIKHINLPAARNMTTTIVGARLLMGREVNMWEHRTGSCAEKARDMTEQDYDLHRFEWRLTWIGDSSPPHWFRATLEVGYVDSAETPFRFLVKGEPLFVDLEVTDSTPTGGPTDQGGNHPDVGVSQADARAMELHQACKDGRVDEVRTLIVDQGVDLDVRDTNGWTALHHACYRGNADLVKLILDSCNELNNAEVSWRTINARTKSRATALHVASTEGDYDITVTLLQYGAAINAKDVHGDTPLICACRNGHSEIARLLLSRGADVNVSNDEGNTGLHFASRHADPELTDILLYYSGLVTKQNKEGDTPVHTACANGNVRVARLLLSRVTDPNISNKSGNTPLHETCILGNTNILKLMLKFGCDLNAVNEKGNTSLHEACVFDHTAVVRALVVGGADINVRNSANATPLILAQKHNCKEIEEILRSANQVFAEAELVSHFILSNSCQFSDQFSSSGGQLQGDSEVELIVPENAIQQPATVSIAGAVCVDLKTVHDTLGLPEDENIVSPAIEYVTDRQNLVFQKPLKVYLPHFLPDSFSLEDVRVYQFYKSSDDDGIQKQEFRAVQSETDFDSLERNVNEGVYCLSKTSGVLVLSSHFSGVVCTYCKNLPPQLHLRLYGQHIQRDTVDVDLFLLVSDKRLKIRDFRKETVPENDEKQFIVHKKLSPVSDFSDTALGARLRLEENEDKWRHRIGSLPEQTLELEDIRPCCPECDIERLDWLVKSKPDSPTAQWFKGVLEVGYLDSSATTFQFYERPRPQMMHATLQLIGEQTSQHTQTEEDTHKDRLSSSSSQASTELHAAAGSETGVPPINITISPSFSTTDSHETHTSNSHNVTGQNERGDS